MFYYRIWPKIFPRIFKMSFFLHRSEKLDSQLTIRILWRHNLQVKFPSVCCALIFVPSLFSYYFAKLSKGKNSVSLSWVDRITEIRIFFGSGILANFYDIQHLRYELEDEITVCNWTFLPVKFLNSWQSKIIRSII